MGWVKIQVPVMPYYKYKFSIGDGSYTFIASEEDETIQLRYYPDYEDYGYKNALQEYDG